MRYAALLVLLTTGVAHAASPEPSSAMEMSFELEDTAGEVRWRMRPPGDARSSALMSGNVRDWYEPDLHVVSRQRRSFPMLAVTQRDDRRHGYWTYVTDLAQGAVVTVSHELGEPGPRENDTRCPIAGLDTVASQDVMVPAEDGTFARQASSSYVLEAGLLTAIDLVVEDAEPEPSFEHDLRVAPQLRPQPRAVTSIGVDFVRMPDGDLVTLAEMLNGRRDGFFYVLYDDRAPAVIGGYEDDLAHGYWVWFRPDGRAVAASLFVFGDEYPLTLE